MASLLINANLMPVINMEKLEILKRTKMLNKFERALAANLIEKHGLKYAEWKFKINKVIMVNGEYVYSFFE